MATYHDLAHYAHLMAGIREAIAADRYEEFCRETLARYEELAERDFCCGEGGMKVRRRVED